ncbi:hypothetical protein [Novosphingobium colocasiae]|uniref:hypothetical protein n=1 Tax=Novosphingobium colocasiae TaxID=1256513 RepID=UPI0035B2FDF9
MTSRNAIGWQTTLADLSLILFLITAAAAGHRVPRPTHPLASATRPPEARALASPRAEPLAVWIAAPGAPPLGRWLDSQSRDPRQQVTVIVRYRAADGPLTALATADPLMRAAGQRARLVVEPGEGPPRAVIAFDPPEPR